MPLLSLAAKNAMLDALLIDTLSLHTAFDVAGANEVIGGSPAYARLAVTFAPALLGTRLLSGGPYVFNVPATTIGWIGMWDVSGGFLGMTPNRGGILNPFAVDDTSTDILKCAGHGFVVNDSLVVWSGSAGPLPLGLYEGAAFYVIVATTDTLQLSATLGGAAIDLGITGNGFLQGISVVTTVGQDVFTVSALTLDATVAA